MQAATHAQPIRSEAARARGRRADARGRRICNRSEALVPDPAARRRVVRRWLATLPTPKVLSERRSRCTCSRTSPRATRSHGGARRRLPRDALRRRRRRGRAQGGRGGRGAPPRRGGGHGDAAVAASAAPPPPARGGPARGGDAFSGAPPAARRQLLRRARGPQAFAAPARRRGRRGEAPRKGAASRSARGWARRAARAVGGSSSRGRRDALEPGEGPSSGRDRAEPRHPRAREARVARQGGRRGGTRRCRAVRERVDAVEGRALRPRVVSTDHWRRRVRRCTPSLKVRRVDRDGVTFLLLLHSGAASDDVAACVGTSGADGMARHRTSTSSRRARRVVVPRSPVHADDRADGRASAGRGLLDELARPTPEVVGHVVSRARARARARHGRTAAARA